MGEDEEETREGGGVADAVKSKLVQEGHLALVEVADKMPSELQEAILVDSLPPIMLQQPLTSCGRAAPRTPCCWRG